MLAKKIFQVFVKRQIKTVIFVQYDGFYTENPCFKADFTLFLVKIF